MTNTITISFLSELRGFFSVADILTMIESVTDKRNVYESQAI